MEKKYIDAEKLIKSVKNYQEGVKAAFNPIDGDADYYKGKIDACEDIKDIIASLQQEQPQVELDNHTIMEEIRKCGCNPNEFDVARHFYELGQRTKYQQDRAEFAKLKAKEWQEGYDEGYAKGYNAGKGE